MTKNAKANGKDGVVVYERALLGTILETPELWPQASHIEASDFVTPSHRAIWSTLQRLYNAGGAIDIVTLVATLGEAVSAEYVASLVDGIVKPNFPQYVAAVRQGGRARQFHRLQEKLECATDDIDRMALVRRMQELLVAGEGESGRGAWRSIFHSPEDFERAKPITFAIDNFLQEDSVTILAGLAGHGKTLSLLSVCKALLTTESLFGCGLFRVQTTAKRVVYLIPESSLSPFWARIRLFRLEQYVRDDSLLVRTLSHPEPVALGDPRLLRAVQDSSVVLDTVCRFLVGNENDAEVSRQFANSLFQLLSAGARSIIAAHHSPKSFESNDRPSLETALRGSSDIGALAATVWIARQVDSETNSVFFSAVKCRDFEAPGDFLLRGRPDLDEHGNFRMIAAPGQAKTLKHYLDEERERDRDTGGRPILPNKAEKARQAALLRSEGKSLREIATIIGISKSAVDRLLFDHDSLSQECPAGTGFRDKKEPGPQTGRGLDA